MMIIFRLYYIDTWKCVKCHTIYEKCLHFWGGWKTLLDIHYGLPISYEKPFDPIRKITLTSELQS